MFRILLLSFALLTGAQLAHAEDLSLCIKGWKIGQQGNFKKGISLHKKCLKKGRLTEASKARAYRNIGIFYKQLEQYKKAINHYDKALTLSPDDPWDDYVNRGNAWSLLGELDKALADYDKAFEAKPHYHEVYYNRGIVHEANEYMELLKADIEEKRREKVIGGKSSQERDNEEVIIPYEVPSSKVAGRVPLIYPNMTKEQQAGAVYGVRKGGNITSFRKPTDSTKTLSPNMKDNGLFPHQKNLMWAVAQKFAEEKGEDAELLWVDRLGEYRKVRVVEREEGNQGERKERGR